MKKVITILTATRAEYGLLSPIIHGLEKVNGFEVRVVATGAHLSQEFGMTYREIENDGVKIHKKIEILLNADSSTAVSKSMGLAMISFADYFEQSKPDVLLVLGDRYETLAVCCVAVNMGIPIVHLYGGETTEGAIDEAIRHSITKMSYFHFTSTEAYRKRVIQLGEAPDRVFDVGAIGVENALKVKLLSKKELEESIKYKLDNPYAVVTYHPVTLEVECAEQQFEQLLSALDSVSDMKYIFTKANADYKGRVINEKIEQYVKNHDNAVVYDSLGTVRYLSAVKFACMVIGNSSSGIVEVPSFGVPTINIGNRQKGRIQGKSIINCEPIQKEIIGAMKKARSIEFLKDINEIHNPYGDGETTDKIIKILQEKLLNSDINLQKKFYDIGDI